MTLRIEQDATYSGPDYWRWTVRLRGRQAELDRVAKVTWLLHESFSPSVVEIEDRTTRFALSGGGWGSFDLRAQVVMRSGRCLQLEHLLELFYPEEPAPAAPASLPNMASNVAQVAPPPVVAHARKVFLSYGSEDRSRAGELRVMVETLGGQVLDPRLVDAGVPWQRVAAQMIRDCDAVVGLLSSEFPSPYLAEEMVQAVKLHKPLLLLKGKNVAPRALGLPADVYTHSVAIGDDAAVHTALLSILAPR